MTAPPTRALREQLGSVPAPPPVAAARVRRPATTFKVRRRGLSPKRQAELDTWIRTWGLDPVGPPLDWDEVFGEQWTALTGVVLDVGFGHGESTVQLARREPHLGVIGVEVHTPGVVTVLDAVVNDPLPHVRVVHADLLPFLDRVGADSLAGVRVFFPDPWRKARQHHRRLVRADVVTAFVDRLVPGGFLHLATDIADYADQMLTTCAAEARLTGGPIDRPPDRPLTRFERRGLDAGRAVADLWYERRR
jgi:tRNA (guanine-N7-)-methyltransferase